MSTDIPIEEYDGEKWVAEVIDLADVRIAWGRSPFRTKTCDHKSLVYSQSERRIWCRDCERTIDSFDGFMTLTKHFQAMLSAARYKAEKAAEALNATIIRRAAKEIDRTWGVKMAPCCPHCRAGLLPEDFADGASAAVSREFEDARRKRTRALAQGEERG